MAAKSAEERRAAALQRRSPVAVGDLVAGKYRIERLLAAGGMGIVAAAQHEALGQRVAIKFLMHGAGEDEHGAARFLREARAAARIQSEHVARVFDCGTTEGGVSYMVMEYLEGTDLQAELKERHQLPVAEVVDILLQALDGIADAHVLGIIHRDIKPANLFLAQRAGAPRCVKILDFGISKVEAGPDAPDEGLTATSVMLGSPRYMSPEQAQSSKSVDVRSDIWSLGVVLYEALDGKCPFAGDTMGETLGRILTYEPPSIEAKRGDVPEGLAHVIKRCLQRDRERRFRNVAELALALAPFGSGRCKASVDRVTSLLVEGRLAGGEGGRPVAPPVSTPADEAPTTQVAKGEISGPSAGASASEQTAASWARLSAEPRPGRGRIMVITAVALTAIAALAIGVVIGGSRAPATPAATVAPASPPPAATPEPPATTAKPAPTQQSAPATPPTASASASTPAPATKPQAAGNRRPVPAPAGRTKPPAGVLESSD